MSLSIETEPKKRGRRKKETISTSQTTNDSVNITISIEENGPIETIVKKRGRKPKGGKLIMKQPEKLNTTTPIANIILHLKCSMHDLNEHNNIISQLVTDPLVYNPTLPPNILAYNKTSFSLYDVANELDTQQKCNQFDTTKHAYIDYDPNQSSNICKSCSVNMKDDIVDNDDYSDINIKDVNTKLKQLKIQLYKNVNPDKKSACFWCTYDYDNPSCYIPKYEMDSQIFGYGSFCRPECAVAYLMKENIDDSTKFERYHLLNMIYSKVYDFKRNIKPAPNPYYLLDKFYGNLSIQEYRKLLKTEHMLLVIDKPLTRILPELHEDNDDFISNIYGNTNTSTAQSGGAYKVKRDSEKQKSQTKSSIMKERFGL